VRQLIVAGRRVWVLSYQESIKMQTWKRRRGSVLEALEGRRLLSGSAAADIVVAPSITLSPAATSASPRGYTPAQVRQAYGFDSVRFNGIVGDGTGQTIAIVDAYNDPDIAGDLSVFSSTFGLPQANLSVVNQAGGKSLPKTDAGWAGETALDVEWAHAMAPAAKILLVEANSDSLRDLLSAVDTARNAAGVSVVSMSWGTSEFSSETAYDAHFTTPAGHQGVTFVAASGDTGSWYGPDWPASSPNVLSVGGTTLALDSAGNVASETAWDDSTGGYSRFEAARPYQSAATGSYRRTGPDVAFDADPATGFAVYDTVPYQGVSGWATVGGTSAGAPQWAALVAIANQGRALNGQASLDGASGTLPTLYSLYAAPGSASYAAYAASFSDVTETAQQFVYAGRRVEWVVQDVTTGVGYDTATGLGTPEVPGVVSALVGAKAATTTTAVKRTMRVRIHRHLRRADEVFTKTTTESEATNDTVRPTGPSVATTGFAPAITGTTTLPTVTFVLAQIRVLPPVHPPYFSEPAGHAGPTAIGRLVAPAIPVAPVAAGETVRPTAAVDVLPDPAPAPTNAIDDAARTTTTTTTGVERMVAGAGAAFAAAVSAISSTAVDGWETPVAAAGAVLMFSWAVERVARLRSLSRDARYAAPFNLIRVIGEE
jgi:hypothetical protein